MAAEVCSRTINYSVAEPPKTLILPTQTRGAEYHVMLFALAAPEKNTNAAAGLLNNFHTLIPLIMSESPNFIFLFCI